MKDICKEDIDGGKCFNCGVYFSKGVGSTIGTFCNDICLGEYNNWLEAVKKIEDDIMKDKCNICKKKLAACQYNICDDCSMDSHTATFTNEASRWCK